MAARHIPDAEVGDPAPRSGWSVINIWLTGYAAVGLRVTLCPKGFEFADEPALTCLGVIYAAG